jgi:hypothetical protein
MALDPSQATSLTDGSAAGASTVDALSVYVEPLVADARVAVLGDGELGLHERLLELGARTVHVYDPDPERAARVAGEVPRGVSVRVLRDELDVRDAAFDLVLIPDVGVLPDPSSAIGRVRRVLDGRGAVVAMGRARTSQDDDGSFPELAPAVVEYAELYDLFALQFESVTMTGVLPFEGVVFAELGAGDDLAVSVDTRLVDSAPPGVFVVVAGRESSSLDPYAIVQVVQAARESAGADPRADRINAAREHEIASAFAAMQLRAELLAAQLDEHRGRLVSADSRGAEQASRFERLAFERDAAMTRASELEGIVAAAQHAMALLERRLVAAEEGMLERDDQIAALNAELDVRLDARLDARATELETKAVEPIDMAVAAELLARAERAEASLALHVADLAHVSEAHAGETAGLEAQLRERASVITSMEKELARREQLVRELVASLDEARDGNAPPGAGVQFEAAPAMPGVAPEEVARLRRKLDELALEVARRDGELVAQAWRVVELENEKARLALRAAPPASTDGPGELARTRDELDALRQALTQEHAARVAAESGEELSRARAELARQAALLEQISGRGTHQEG